MMEIDCDVILETPGFGAAFYAEQRNRAFVEALDEQWRRNRGSQGATMYQSVGGYGFNPFHTRRFATPFPETLLDNLMRVRPLWLGRMADLFEDWSCR